jgi:hypothetical protein
MPNRGDLVFYNNGDENVNLWCVGQVLQTDTDPDSDAVAAAQEEFDSSPDQPAEGQVYIGYWERNGNTQSYPATAFASEGTSPGQYSTTLPDSSS